MKCNAVFEGGGVRSIGHIGAASVIESAGYTFENVAGCSAGAIVAALIAVGYSTNEIKDIIGTLDYTKFKQKNFFDYFGIAGKALNLYTHLGLYRTDYFENWMKELINKKGKIVFGDIKSSDCLGGKCKYKLQLVVSDITDKVELILPQDLELFGINPDTFFIAEAVRMSMSIPFFYRPSILTDADGKQHYIVDGGLLSNYPLYLLDDGCPNPPYPTFGFKFVEKPDKLRIDPIKFSSADIISYIRLVTTTALDGHDNEYIAKSKGDLQRTIKIPVSIMEGDEIKYINSTYFSINKEESAKLYQNGVLAAEKFLSAWNFDVWKEKYRGADCKCTN